MNPGIENLIEGYLEGTLDQAEIDELQAWLQKDSGNMQVLVQAAMRDQMLCDAASAAFVTQEVRAVTHPALNVSGDTNTSGSDLADGSASQRRMVSRGVALVAGLAACLLVGYWVYQRSESDAVQTAEERPVEVLRVDRFSTVAMVHESDSELRVGERLSAESIQVERGIVRLQFDDGVEVTLQGPAHYELIAPGKTRLHSGLLTATVPPGAEGFRVDTPSAQVVDLGTAFGIEQSPGGDSKVSVFDGEVEVISSAGSGKRLLVEGDSIQLAKDGSMREAEFSTQQYEKLWPATSGIVGSTGAFRFAPQWPRLLKRVESDSDLFVLPEGYARELEQPCPVDPTGNTLAGTEIPAGQRVRSFLLQFNPVDTGGQGANQGPGPGSGRRGGRRIAGSITFERPILGLIIKTETLEETDQMFSLRRAGMMPGRGLEERPPRLADRVSLSEDGRTLTLDLFVVNRLSDHVRVIVDATLKQSGGH